MGRKALSDQAEKRLSLAELASHDDVCTDVMIDNAFFKSRIRKNRNKHIPVRGVKEDDVPKILLHRVIVDKNPVAAEKELLKLQGIKRYRSGLRSKIVQERFLGHFRKYIHMYMTDCAWEVSTTNRYTITTYEAAVTARRNIKQGEIIKYLTGTLVPLTAEESDDLDLTQRNFSIVVSSRKKNSSIFLGPARFANHDCNANGRLVMRGSEAMEVIAMKNIGIGEEITVSYGNDYFGRDNVECLCHTCEDRGRNGWTSKDAFGSPRSSASTPSNLNFEAQPYAFRRKRRYSEASSTATGTPPAKKLKNSTSPSKLQQSWTPQASFVSDQTEPKPVAPADSVAVEVGSSPEESSFSGAENARCAPQVDGAGDSVSISPPRQPSSLAMRSDSALPNGTKGSSRKSSKSQNLPRIDKMTARLLGSLPTPKATPTTSQISLDSFSEDKENISTSLEDAESAVEMKIPVTVKIESIEISKLESDHGMVSQPAFNGGLTSVCVESAASPTSEQSAPVALVASGDAQAITVLTTTRVSTTQPANAGSSVLPSVEEATTTSHLTVQPVSDAIRVPGDYLLTRKLLAQPHDRWIQCRNVKCGGYFVQPNGYQTRRECPRCERHSMLYGYAWPKTDPDVRKLLERRKEKAERSAFKRKGKSGKGTWVEGGGDDEERVMDHRTVHRFVFPEEEREVKRRGLLRDAERRREDGNAITPISETVPTGNALRGGGSESLARDMSESGSATPDEGWRRSRRFVPTRVYADISTTGR